MKKYIPYILVTCLIVGLTFLLPETVFTQVSQREIGIEITDSLTATNEQGYTYVKGITSGRARSLIGGLIGLTSLIIGWQSKIRSSQIEAKIAITLGFLAILLDIMHLSTVAGSVFGFGSGKAGSLVALPLAITGTILGWLTLKNIANLSEKNQESR